MVAWECSSTIRILMVAHTGLFHTAFSSQISGTAKSLFLQDVGMVGIARAFSTLVTAERSILFDVQQSHLVLG